MEDASPALFPLPVLSCHFQEDPKSRRRTAEKESPRHVVGGLTCLHPGVRGHHVSVRECPQEAPGSSYLRRERQLLSECFCVGVKRRHPTCYGVVQVSPPSSVTAMAAGGCSRVLGPAEPTTMHEVTVGHEMLFMSRIGAGRPRAIQVVPPSCVVSRSGGPEAPP